MMTTLPRLKGSSASAQRLDRLSWSAGISVRSYGVRIGIRTNEPTILESVLEHLPPGWEPSSSPWVDELFSLRIVDAGPETVPGSVHQLYQGGKRIADKLNLDDLLDRLESQLRIAVAVQSRSWLFVHAGVVSWGEQGIVIPGRSMSGKSTLVAALVQAGATYYSDEFAVLDGHGRVHPFPKTLSLRQGPGKRPRRCSAEALGGIQGVQPLPVGLVVVTQYASGAHWDPQVLSPGESLLALLDNTLVARLRPAMVLRVLSRVATRGTTLKGRRGQAVETVKRLLDGLQNASLQKDCHHFV